MSIVPMRGCDSCGAEWPRSHRPTCGVPAQAFLDELDGWGWAETDDYPRCPKCGEQDEYWTDGAPRHASDGSRWSISCGHCEHEYEVELRVSYSFHVERPASGIVSPEGIETAPAGSTPKAPEPGPAKQGDAHHE